MIALNTATVRLVYDIEVVVVFHSTMCNVEKLVELCNLARSSYYRIIQRVSDRFVQLDAISLEIARHEFNLAYRYAEQLKNIRSMKAKFRRQILEAKVQFTKH